MMGMSGKVPFPPGKGIMCILNRIPTKTREKPRFRGEGTRTVNDLPFEVDDKNYPDHFGETIFVTMTDHIVPASGDYKATDSCRFIEQALAKQLEGKTYEEKCAIMAPYDDNYLSKLAALAAPLLKHYVIFMKESRTDAQGQVWQDPKEIKTLEEMEWDLEARRMPPAEVSKRLGKPVKPAQTSQSPEPEAQPPAPPKEEPKVTRPEPKPIADVDDELRAWIQPGTNFLAITRGFLSKHGAHRVSLMEEDKRRHLWALLMIETYLTVKDQHEAAQYRAKVDEYLQLRDCTGLLELERLDVDLLLGNLEDIAAGVPF